MAPVEVTAHQAALTAHSRNWWRERSTFSSRGSCYGSLTKLLPDTLQDLLQLMQAWTWVIISCLSLVASPGFRAYSLEKRSRFSYPSFSWLSLISCFEYQSETYLEREWTSSFLLQLLLVTIIIIFGLVPGCYWLIAGGMKKIKPKTKWNNRKKPE